MTSHTHPGDELATVTAALPQLLHDTALSTEHPLAVAGRHLAATHPSALVRLAAAAAATYRHWLLPDGWAPANVDEHGIWWQQPRRRLLDVPLLCDEHTRPPLAELHDLVRAASRSSLGPRTRLQTVRLLTLRGPAASLVADLDDGADDTPALRPLPLLPN